MYASMVKKRNKQHQTSCGENFQKLLTNIDNISVVFSQVFFTTDKSHFMVNHIKILILAMMFIVLVVVASPSIDGIVPSIFNYMGTFKTGDYK